MGAYQYMPSCFGKLSLSLKKKCSPLENYALVP